MSFISKLHITLDLEKNYEERWSDGGTYGTCWDEDGPSECAVEAPLDYSTYNDYKNTVDIIYKYFNIEGPEDNRYYRYSEVLIFDYDDEADYYGGCQYFKVISFTTEDLIKTILNNKKGFSGKFSDEEINKIIPEYIL